MDGLVRDRRPRNSHSVFRKAPFFPEYRARPLEHRTTSGGKQVNKGDGRVGESCVHDRYWLAPSLKTPFPLRTQPCST